MVVSCGFLTFYIILVNKGTIHSVLILITKYIKSTVQHRAHCSQIEFALHQRNKQNIDGWRVIK